MKSALNRLMMFSAIGMAMMSSNDSYTDNPINDIKPKDIDVNSGRDILVHNKQHLHTFTVHGVEIQAPNLKAAKKIYDRTKRK